VIVRWRVAAGDVRPGAISGASWDAGRWQDGGVLIGAGSRDLLLSARHFERFLDRSPSPSPDANTRKPRQNTQLPRWTGGNVVNLTTMSNWYFARLMTGEGRADDRILEDLGTPRDGWVPRCVERHLPVPGSRCRPCARTCERPLSEPGGRAGARTRVRRRPPPRAIRPDRYWYPTSRRRSSASASRGCLPTAPGPTGETRRRSDVRSLSPGRRRRRQAAAGGRPVG